MTRFAVLACLFLTVSAAGAYAYEDDAEDISVDTTLKALEYHLRNSPAAMRQALRDRGYILQAYQGKDAREREAARALETLPEGFKRIADINAASRAAPVDDRDNTYEAVSRYTGENVTGFDHIGQRREAERFCDKYLRRIGEREAYNRCLFRFIATEIFFADDVSQCARDTEGTLPGAEASEKRRRDYLCMRRAGWRHAENMRDNIDVPAAE